MKKEGRLIPTVSYHMDQLDACLLRFAKKSQDDRLASGIKRVAARDFRISLGEIGYSDAKKNKKRAMEEAEKPQSQENDSVSETEEQDVSMDSFKSPSMSLDETDENTLPN